MNRSGLGDGWRRDKSGARSRLGPATVETGPGIAASEGIARSS